MMTSRKRRTIIKRRINLSSQQFEFSVNCPYSACLTRLRDLDATLKLRYELSLENTKKGYQVPVPPRIEIEDMGESASFAWHFGAGNAVILQGTVQAVTSENTRLVGVTFESQEVLVLLLFGIIVAAVVVYLVLSAYVSPASMSWMVTVDTRCMVGILGAPVILAIGILTLFFYQRSNALNTLISAFDDC